MATINEDHRVLARRDKGFEASPKYPTPSPSPEGLIEVHKTSNNAGTYRYLVFEDEWQEFCNLTGYTVEL